MTLTHRQMKRKGNRRVNRQVAAAAMATIASGGLLSQAVRAANDAWGTAPVSVNFSGTNWTTGTTTPGANTGNVTSGDTLYFGASTSTSLNDDNVNFTYGGINFNAGAPGFTIAGNAFTLSGNINNNSTSLQIINDAITLGGNESINSASGAVTLGGNITGGGTFGITLTGPAAVTLSGANTLSTMTLGTSVVANTNNNTALTGEVGTTLNLNSTQNIGAIVVGTGANVINVGANAAVTSTTITQANGSDRFDALNINLASGASMSTTAANNTAGLITINAQFNVVTLNGTDFATNSSGNIAAASYTNSTATSIGSSSQNTNIIGNVSLSNSPTTNTLRFGATTGYTVAVASGQSLLLNGTNGAILMSAASGNVTNTITGGTLSGSSNRGLAILNFDTTSGASLVINSNYNNYPISGTGSGGTADLLVAGGGTVVLGGANFINGDLLVDGSTLSVASDSNLGAVNSTVSVTTATNGNPTVTLTSANTNTSGLAVGDVLLGQTISSISSNGTGTSVTLSGNYTGTSITSATAVGFVGGGSVNLNGGTLAVTSTFAMGETNNTGNGTTGVNNVRNRNIGLGSKGGTVDVSNGNILTVPGVISGAGPFTMTDSGTLVLTGANIYTGTTILNGGVTNLGIAQNGTTSGPLGAGASTQAIDFTGGTLQYSSSNNTDYSARIAAGASAGAVAIDTNGVNVSFGTGLTASESGGLTKLGNGTLTLSASNAYSGGTTINGGTISQTAAGALGSGTITLGDGSTSASATLSGAVGSTATNANPITIAGGGSGIYTIVDTSGSDYLFSGNISLNNAATFKTTGGGALFLEGSITGSSLITIDGGNSTSKFVDIYASSATTFTGNILVQNAGDLKFGNSVSNAFGTATTLTMDATAILDCGGLSQTFAGLNDVVAGAGLSKVFDNGSNLTLGGSGSYSFSGNISGGGSLTKSGVGTQALTGANGFSGGTAVQNGTLVLGTGGSLASSNTLTLGSGSNSGIFQLGDARGAVNTTVTSLTTAGNGTTNAVVGGNSAVSTLTINTSTTDSFGGLLGGSRTNQNNVALILTGNGAGSLTLSASSSYSGGTVIKAGTISQTAGGALGSGTITLGDGSTSASATLSGAIGSTVTNSNPLTFAGGGNGAYTIVNTSGSDYNFSGNIALNNAATFKTTSGGAMFLSGPITGSSLVTFDGGNSTTKFVELDTSSAGTFTGNILVQNKGLLKFGGGASNALSTASTLTLDATSSMDTGLLSQTFAGLNDVVAGAGGSTIINAGGGTTLTLGGNGSYSFSGNISGAGGLTKSGIGAQVLAGSSSYTGGTTISAGTLFANNAANSIGNGTVALNGGTLAGNGTINNGSNLLTVAGGTIRPGGTTTGTATLATGNQKWNSGAMAIKINDTGNATTGSGVGSGTAGSTTGWGEVVMSGLSVSSLSAASPFAITLTSPGGSIGDFSNTSSYLWQIGQINSGTTPITQGILATTDSTGANVPTSGELFTLNTSSFAGSNSIPSGSSFYLEAVATGGGEELAIGYSGTPEPGTTILILGGVVPTLMARRRRRAKL